MKKILDKRKMSESDWQEYRKNQKGIGGSDIGIILGINPYKSKFELWLEKTDQSEKPDINNQFMEWGNLLEPVIRKHFAKLTGFRTIQNNFVLQHDIHDFMIANIDGNVQDPAFSGLGILEIKTTSAHNKKDWENGCPIHYMAQLQWYLGVTDSEYGYICVLIGGNDFRYYLVQRDDYIIDKMISEAARFTELVENRIPPEIGGSETETKWLAKSFPNAVDEMMDMPPLLEQRAIEYTRLQEEIKMLTTRADAIKNQIKLEGKEFKTLIGNQVKISMPTINKILFDSKLFASEHPDLYEQYKTKESSYRGFTINLLGE